MTGKEIRIAREKLGLKQRELAKEVNVSRAHLSQVEAGNSNPSNSLISRLRKALRIPDEPKLRTNVKTKKQWQDFLRKKNGA